MSDESVDAQKSINADGSAEEGFEIDDSVEQQQIADVESGSITYQERIMNLYNHKHLRWIAVGFWLKLSVEAAIIAVPIFLLAILASVLTYFGVVPISYLWIAGSFPPVVVSLTAAAWCFTERANTEEDD